MSHSNVLQQVVKLIGVHSTIRLVRSRGGAEFGLPLPQHLTYMHGLVIDIGFDNAVKLCEEFRGERIKLPIEVNALLQLRNQMIVEEYRHGESTRSLAKRYSIDRKMIENILLKHGCRGVDITPQDQQMGLL